MPATPDPRHPLIVTGRSREPKLIYPLMSVINIGRMSV